MKRLILAATLAIAVPAFAQDAAAPASDAGAAAAAPAATPTDTTAAPAATPAADSSAPAATAAAPAAASTDLPVCSRTVTDRCIEKGSAPKKKARSRKKK